MEKRERIKHTFLQLFRAEILGLLGTLLATMTAFSSLVNGVTNLTVILLFASAIILFVADIIKILTLSKSKNDSKYFNIAYAIALGSLILSLIDSYLPTEISNIASKLCNVADLVVSGTVIFAVSDLSIQYANKDLSLQANKVCKIYIVFAVAAALASNILPVIMDNAILYNTIYIFLLLFAYVVYLRLLNNASKNL